MHHMLTSQVCVCMSVSDRMESQINADEAFFFFLQCLHMHSDILLFLKERRIWGYKDGFVLASLDLDCIPFLSEFLFIQTYMTASILLLEYLWPFQLRFLKCVRGL